MMSKQTPEVMTSQVILELTDVSKFSFLYSISEATVLSSALLLLNNSPKSRQFTSATGKVGFVNVFDVLSKDFTKLSTYVQKDVAKYLDIAHALLGLAMSLFDSPCNSM